MIKVVTNSNGSGGWIVVQDHGGTTLFSGHGVDAHDLQYILSIVSRDGCKLVEVDDKELETYTG